MNPPDDDRYSLLGDRLVLAVALIAVALYLAGVIA